MSELFISFKGMFIDSDHSRPGMEASASFELQLFVISAVKEGIGAMKDLPDLFKIRETFAGNHEGLAIALGGSPAFFDACKRLREGLVA